MKLTTWALLGSAGYLYLRNRAPELTAVPERPLTSAERTRIAKLVPEVQAKVFSLIKRTASRGVQLFVGSTDRTPAEQLEKIREGRSGATRSWHLAARAADIYIIGPDGEPDTGGKYPELYKVMGKAARELGFTWFGVGTIVTKLASYTDPNHVEYHGGKTWETAMASIGRSPTPVRVA